MVRSNRLRCAVLDVVLLFGCAICRSDQEVRPSRLPRGYEADDGGTPNTSTINILSSTNINDILSDEASLPIDTKALDRCNIVAGPNRVPLLREARLDRDQALNRMCCTGLERGNSIQLFSVMTRMLTLMPAVNHVPEPHRTVNLDGHIWAMACSIKHFR